MGRGADLSGWAKATGGRYAFLAFYNSDGGRCAGKVDASHVANDPIADVLKQLSPGLTGKELQFLKFVLAVC